MFMIKSLNEGLLCAYTLVRGFILKYNTWNVENTVNVAGMMSIWLSTGYFFIYFSRKLRTPHGKNRWTSWAVWERCAAAVSVLIDAKRKKADAGYTACSGHNVSFFPWISYKDLSFFVHSGGCCGKEQHEHYCLIWPRLAFVLEMSQKKIQHTQNTLKKIHRKHSSQLNNLIVAV